MRRISLALALLGAVAAAGCGGAGSKSPASSGGNKGVEDASFKLVVVGEGTPTWDATTSTTVVIPKGGVVTGGGINCGVDSAGSHTTCSVLIPYNNTTPVVLTATPNTPTYNVWMWAGACGGTAGCSFLMTDTRTVAIRFAADAAGLGAHPNFTDHRLHGLEYFKAYVTKTSPLNCTTSTCHGAQLQGVGLAPACTKCHPFSVTWDMQSPMMGANGHFDTGGQFDMGSGPCARCHTTGGFLDYIGVKNITVNGQAYTFPGNSNYLNVPQLTGPAYIGTTEWLAPATGTVNSGYGFAFQPTNELVTVAPYEDGPGIIDMANGVTYQDPLPLVSTDGSYMSNLTLKCQTCHNPVADVFTGLNPGAPGLTQVTVSNGSQVTTDHATALCAQCHAGNVAGFLNKNNGGTGIGSRGSLASASWEIDAIASGATSLYPMPTNKDAIIDGNGGAYLAQLFPQSSGGHASNGIIPFPHRMIAASTYFGSASATYYQYANQVYDGVNKHGACTDCHGAHTLQVNVTAQTCGRCHFKEGTGVPVTDLADLAANRQLGFQDIDVDGNGAVEGLDAEIFGPTALSCAAGTCKTSGGLVNALGAAMQTYASTVLGTGICFTWGDHLALYSVPVGSATPTDMWTPAACPSGTNPAFYSFTPALVRAIYNFQAIQEDPGAWAHNPRYAIEVLYDSIADLQRGIVAKGGIYSFPGSRSFAAHFGYGPGAANGMFATFHYVPAGGSFTPTVGQGCVICHGADTADYFVSLATTTKGPGTSTGFVSAPLVTGFSCYTCHQPAAGTFGDPSAPGFTGDLSFTTFYPVSTIRFPLEADDTDSSVWNTASVAGLNYFVSGDFMCMTCHTGRPGVQSGTLASSAQKNNTAGTVAINNTILSTGITDSSFVSNVPQAVANHGYSAAATLLGTHLQPMYEYQPDLANSITGAYNGYAGFTGSPAPHGGRCSGCHDYLSTGHSFVIDYVDNLASTTPGTVPTGPITGFLATEMHVAPGTPNTLACADCHSGGYSLVTLQNKVNGLANQLGLDIMAYVAANESNAIACYGMNASHQMVWSQSSAAPAAGTTACPTGATLTALPINRALLKAMYNYTYVATSDPNAWAHNYTYVEEALIDSMVYMVGPTNAYQQAAALGIPKRP